MEVPRAELCPTERILLLGIPWKHQTAMPCQTTQPAACTWHVLPHGHVAERPGSAHKLEGIVTPVKGPNSILASAPNVVCSHATCCHNAKPNDAAAATPAALREVLIEPTEVGRGLNTYYLSTIKVGTRPHTDVHWQISRIELYKQTDNGTSQYAEIQSSM